MGFISTLVVLNDCLHEIGRDKDFGQKVVSAVQQLPGRDPVWIDSCALAVESHHNSGYVTVIVGRGMGYPLSGFSPSPGEDAELSLLKALANKHGYRLSRRPAEVR